MGKWWKVLRRVLKGTIEALGSPRQALGGPRQQGKQAQEKQDQEWYSVYLRDVGGGHQRKCPPVLEFLSQVLTVQWRVLPH